MIKVVGKRVAVGVLAGHYQKRSGKASTVCTVLAIRRWVGGSWHYFGEGVATFLGLSAGELV